MKSLRSRLIFLILISLGAAYYVAPTLIYFSLPKDQRNDQEVLAEAIPDWLPQEHIKLGLDLQGGVQLVLGVNTEVAVSNKLGRMGTEITRWANEEEKNQVKQAYVPKDQPNRLRVILQDGVDVGDFKVGLADQYPGFEQTDRDGRQLDFGYSENELKRIREAALEQAERVVRSRVDKWGVSEPAISRRADGSILVQLPGFKDPERARELLGRTAQLQFKILDEEFTGFDSLIGNLPPNVSVERRGNNQVISLVSEDKETLVELAKGKIPEGRQLMLEETQIAGGKKTRYTTHVVKAATELSGEDVLDATVTFDPNSLDQRPAVSLQFTGVGGKRFAEITGNNIGTRMAIVLDNVVISDPVIQTEIAGGTAQITMGSDRSRQEVQEEAQQLALILRSGALPAPIKILEERQVGATLGPELANEGVFSVLVGLFLVLVYMIVYYRRPGMISAAVLILNGLFLLALMASFGFALTLPGFAGFILTLGMAVDANVLINERIRQELREGKPAKKSVENGFNKVFWTIIDANVTTLIAAFVLIETNSSGPIKGFAVALIIGLLVSMFTSLFVTRVFFDTVTNRDLSDKQIRSWLGAQVAEKQSGFRLDFLKHGKKAAIIGGLIVVAVFAVGGARGINWSVDFAGGTEMEVMFDKPVPTKELRQALNDAGIASPVLQVVGGERDHYQIRFENVDQQGTMSASDTNEEGIAEVESLRTKINQSLAEYGPDIQRVDFVGPLIGQELRRQGILSVVWAIIGILVYIGLRFDMRFAPGAVYKMLQDVFIMLGFYVFFYRSFDLTSVAALLTVVGYSVNDTIVIYDRIRENLSLNPRRKLYENINFSLNETLTRTINTSVTTIVALGGILIFGSAQIWNFAAAMAIGVLAATFSSTFIASSFILWSENWKKTSKVKRAATAS
jgi:protein-export membrane protein SecD/preprotein translocase SecF subunit